MTAGGAAQGSGVVASIAERYAGALFDLAEEAGSLETVERDLATLGAALDASGELRAVFQSPIYAADEQMRVAQAIAARAGVSPLTANFLSLVAKNRRLFAFQAMIAAFRARLAAHRGEIAAEAISAAPLSAEQEKRLRTEIESIVGKAVNLSTRVDEALLGGLVVKVGSKMIDSSLRTKLNRMKSVMKEA
ncbi:MAG: F0F1 ATP synthase subunit delta [Alphaproteobacteria bacterium]|nr:F0F1 ATP synthase subunit delta [Alphaproteobacteria bacterium]